MNARNGKRNNSSTLTVIFISLALIVLNVVRILHVPLTHDEGLTYLYYVKGTWSDIYFCNPPSANNHILNSILTKLITSVFGYAIFWLRFANLLAQVVYLWVSYLLVRRLFPDKWWQLLGFIFLNINPFLFNFWGLSRGYGLSLSMMMCSVYLLVKYLDNKKNLVLICCLLFGIAAVYSNLTLLNYFLSLGGVLLLSSFIVFKENKRKIFPAQLSMLLISGGIIYLLIAKVVHKLIATKQLYYGGTNGLVKDTIKSLVGETVFANMPYITCVMIAAYIVMLSIVGIGIYQLIKYIKHKGEGHSATRLLLWLLLAIPLLSELVQHWLLNNLYLIDRTALFILPLYMLVLVQWLYDFKKIGKYIAAALSLFLVVNFVWNTNISEARMWEYDKHDVAIFKKILSEHKNDNKKIKMRVFWMFGPSMEYYSTTKYQDRFYKVQDIRSDIVEDTSYDYYYINIGDKPIISDKYEVDTTFSNGHYLLMKKR